LSQFVTHASGGLNFKSDQHLLPSALVYLMSGFSGDGWVNLRRWRNQLLPLVESRYLFSVT